MDGLHTKNTDLISKPCRKRLLSTLSKLADDAVYVVHVVLLLFNRSLLLLHSSHTQCYVQCLQVSAFEERCRWGSELRPWCLQGPGKARGKVTPHVTTRGHSSASLPGQREILRRLQVKKLQKRSESEKREAGGGLRELPVGAHQLACTASMSLTRFCARQIPKICGREKRGEEAELEEAELEEEEEGPPHPAAPPPHAPAAAPRR